MRWRRHGYAGLYPWERYERSSGRNVGSPFSGKESRIVVVQWQLHESLRSRDGAILQPPRLSVIMTLFSRLSCDDSR